jgi:hypothetical protein
MEEDDGWEEGEIDNWMFFEKRKGNGCVSIFLQMCYVIEQNHFHLSW